MCADLATGSWPFAPHATATTSATTPVASLASPPGPTRLASDPAVPPSPVIATASPAICRCIHGTRKGTGTRARRCPASTRTPTLAHLVKPVWPIRTAQLSPVAHVQPQHCGSFTGKSSPRSRRRRFKSRHQRTYGRGRKYRRRTTGFIGDAQCECGKRRSTQCALLESVVLYAVPEPSQPRRLQLCSSRC